MFYTHIIISPTPFMEKVTRLFRGIVAPLPINFLRNKEQGTRNKELVHFIYQ